MITYQQLWFSTFMYSYVSLQEGNRVRGHLVSDIIRLFLEGCPKVFHRNSEMTTYGSNNSVSMDLHIWHLLGNNLILRMNIESLSTFLTLPDPFPCTVFTFCTIPSHIKLEEFDRLIDVPLPLGWWLKGSPGLRWLYLYLKLHIYIHLHTPKLINCHHRCTSFSFLGK